MRAARKFILDLLFIKYSALRWENYHEELGKDNKKEKIRLRDKAAGTGSRQKGKRLMLVKTILLWRFKSIFWKSKIH